MKELAGIVQAWIEERESLANADPRLLASLKEWARDAENVWALADSLKGGDR